MGDVGRRPYYGRDVGRLMGDVGRRPYGRFDENDCMDVVGHDNKCIQMDTLPNVFASAPYASRDVPIRAQFHFSCCYLSEYRVTVLRTECDKIPPDFGIVVATQTNGSPVFLSSFARSQHS